MKLFMMIDDGLETNMCFELRLNMLSLFAIVSENTWRFVVLLVKFDCCVFGNGKSKLSIEKRLKTPFLGKNEVSS